MFETSWISRLTALLLLAAVVLAIFLWVVEPLRSAYATADSAIEEARELLFRYERIVSLKTSLEQQAASLPQDGGTDDSYLVGETDALAAAALQSRVASLIAATGGGVSSLQVLPTRGEAGLRRITIRLQFSTTIEPLARVLHELETGKPALFVDNLDIQSRGSLGFASESNPEVERGLAVGLDLYGFLPSAVTEIQP